MSLCVSSSRRPRRREILAGYASYNRAPTYTAASSYTIITVVDSAGELSSRGSVSMKPPTPLASCQAGSSSLPSSTGGCSIRTAVIVRAARPPAWRKAEESEGDRRRSAAATTSISDDLHHVGAAGRAVVARELQEQRPHSDRVREGQGQYSLFSPSGVLLRREAEQELHGVARRDGAEVGDGGVPPRGDPAPSDVGAERLHPTS